MTALPPPADEQADNRTLDPLYRSDCHNAAVYVVGTDEGTNHYECVACKEACNYHPVGEQAAADELNIYDIVNKIFEIMVSNPLVTDRDIAVHKLKQSAALVAAYSDKRERKAWKDGYTAGFKAAGDHDE